MARRKFELGAVIFLTLLSGCGSSSDDSSSTTRTSGGAGGAAHSGASSGGNTASAGTFSVAGSSAGGTGSGGSGNLGGASSGSLGGAGANNGGTSNGGTSAAGSGGASGGSTSSDDIVGKVTVGYQGWFNAANDGSNIQPPWWHWTANRNAPAATNATDVANIGIKSWPDVSELTKTYPTNLPNLNGGGAATLYSDWDASTVDTQIKWMQDTGIDTIALQRFGDFRGTGEARNVVAENVRKAAEAHGRKFYIMYDISGWDSFDTDLKSDWTDHIVGELHLTDSPAYAKQGGKPVVCIWGLGYSGHPGTPQTTQDIIDYFHQKGMYVIGGVGIDWRNASGTGWSQTGYGAVFDTLDAISPWMIGAIGNDADSDNYRKNYNEADVAYLHGKGKHYQPCVLPGDLSIKQRKHGDFMWHQFYNMIQIGSDGLYISMYDEYNEGNQIAKTAATSASVPPVIPPSQQGAPQNPPLFPALDEDGTAVSTDYYLRLTADGGKMLRKQIALTATRPTPYQ